MKITHDASKRVMFLKSLFAEDVFNMTMKGEALGSMPYGRLV